ncbi:hydroxymethylbilane synthase [Rathayibacter sp. PhB127]|uniref:hydroxymethylbilane synthase n=1 Tax=unclassified Rathayibacter TaxID=2609250 RepID=UPI000F4B798A|nr:MULTISPECIES: hydroxymethylbilane synthase [unclassified Rathayibacter]ROS28514.1 hydroxymethylbilane synthase [Rathayibacter sp. PhB127]TDX80986.1 hydroxymethylbilane synthase [Rathayibacter sp. PhB151]
MSIRVGTRASALAVAQTRMTADLMAQAAGVPVELVRIESDGDRMRGSLASLGGTGVFVSALRDALLAGRCDAIVHSLKDLPTAPVEGLVLGAVPEREDPRDALCARDGATLATLPRGARVGTGSPRRRAALLAARPDLEIVDIRGNIDTRLGRVAAGSSSPLDAIVLALSGLRRLGRTDAVTEVLDFGVSPHAPGQGALAIEVRDEEPSDELRAALAAVEHTPTRAAITAERALLAVLEAGCAAPIGASATVEGGRVVTRGVVFAVDGSASLSREVAEPIDNGSVDGPRHLAVSQYGGRELPVVEAAFRCGSLLADALLGAGAAQLAPLGASS